MIHGISQKVNRTWIIAYAENIAQPSPSGLAWTVFDERNLLLLKLDLYTVEFAY